MAMKRLIATLALASLMVVAAACGPGAGSSSPYSGPAGATPGPLDKSPGATFPQSSMFPAYSTVP
jgi:hypothetical protein